MVLVSLSEAMAAAKVNSFLSQTAVVAMMTVVVASTLAAVVATRARRARRR